MSRRADSEIKKVIALMMARRLRAETPQGVGDSQQEDIMGWTRKSYVAAFDWPDKSKREAVKAALIADGLSEIVTRLEAAANLGVWYAITNEAAEAVGESVVADSAVSAEAELNAAAVTPGRKGGKAKTKPKAAANRAKGQYGKLGGRPPRDPEFASWKVEYDVTHPIAMASHTGLWGWGRVDDGLDLSTCIHATRRAAQLARSNGLYAFFLGEKKRLEEARMGIY